MIGLFSLVFLFALLTRKLKSEFGCQHTEFSKLRFHEKVVLLTTTILLMLVSAFLWKVWVHG